MSDDTTKGALEISAECGAVRIPASVAGTYEVDNAVELAEAILRAAKAADTRSYRGPFRVPVFGPMRSATVDDVRKWAVKRP